MFQILNNNKVSFFDYFHLTSKYRLTSSVDLLTPHQSWWKWEKKTQSKENLLVAHKGVFVSLNPLKTPCIARERRTAGAPRDLNVRYCWAGFSMGELYRNRIVPKSLSVDYSNMNIGKKNWRLEGLGAFLKHRGIKIFNFWGKRNQQVNLNEQYHVIAMLQQLSYDLQIYPNIFSEQLVFVFTSTLQ